MSTQYNQGGEYWDRKDSFVMGDVRQRPQLLDLMGDVADKKVLDGGCGTGYFSRKVAALGAYVYGCDIEQSMLDIAAKTQDGIHPIEYVLADITKTNYASEFFDKVVSVGVLFHLDRDGWKAYLQDSQRILKKGGELFISIEHPFLFTKFSPTRTASSPGKRCWAIHTPAVADVGYEQSARFEEKYFNSKGEVYITTLWHHPLSFIFNEITASGFEMVEVREVMVEKEDLKVEHWGQEYGYPAFLQIKLRK